MNILAELQPEGCLASLTKMSATLLTAFPSNKILNGWFKLQKSPAFVCDISCSVYSVYDSWIMEKINSNF